jgi:hypothetical protein
MKTNEEYRLLEQKLADVVQMLSDQDFEYNRKTNALIERHAQQLAEREKERRGVIAESKMHPSWLKKSKEELLDALRFQGATTAALLEETDSYRKQIVMLRDALEYANQELLDFLPEEGKNYYKGSIIGEALDATKDLSGLVLCDAEPAWYEITARDGTRYALTTPLTLLGHTSEPLYVRKQP